jgi:diguanylate cyclase (GGDEF)-like protein
MAQSEPPQTEPPTDGAPHPPTGSTPANWLFFTLKCLFAAGLATGAWCGIWLLMSGAAFERQAFWHLTLPTLILTIVGLHIYREYLKWRKPSRRLHEILLGCLNGEKPIDELEEVGGGLSAVAKVSADLLRELRLARKLNAEMDAELQQRVANRTNHLERKMSSLKAQATRDALTGLFNRRMLEERLPTMIQDCRASGEQLAVLAIDVDNFKPINDTLGHARGDELLKTIAQILRSGIRDNDIAIRSGGDEFVILLPGCPMSAAKALSDRLVAMVESLAKTIKSPLRTGISIGIASLSGVASINSHDATMAALLSAADKQLYLTKSARKHRRSA